MSCSNSDDMNPCGGTSSDDIHPVGDTISSNDSETVSDLVYYLKPNQIIVPVIKSLTYDRFHQIHLNGNFPCVIRKVGEDWKASKLWCQGGKPCFEYLVKEYGDSTITVYHCEEKYFDSHTTSEMKFCEYVDYWKKYNETEDKSKMKLLYLKDWHLKNEYKDDNFYEVPLYFAYDWLNEYLVTNAKDDYRFVYMGPAGSWTPFHKDVLNTYSWSVNICGLKRWLLFPPGEETKLMNGSQLPFTIRQVPHFVKYCEIIQYPGDAVFVPSGWHHIVWNLEDTISINHNWANGDNILQMDLCLRQGLKDVEQELNNLSDDENFRIICQDVLRKHAGMNHEDFFNFIRFIAWNRIRQHVNSNRFRRIDLLVTNNWVLYDLMKCKEMLTYNLKAYLNRENRKEAKKLAIEIEHVMKM